MNAQRRLVVEPWRTRKTILNSTYNMGYLNFVERYIRGSKPIRVCHFHPEYEKYVDVHIRGRNFFHVKTVNARLEQLLRRYFNLLSERGGECCGKMPVGVVPT